MLLSQSNIMMIQVLTQLHLICVCVGDRKKNLQGKNTNRDPKESQHH